MSLDLGSPAIEIAIALSFVFFLLSVIASGLTEWVASLFKLRWKNLQRGVRGMLGDEEVADKLLDHPLVRTELRLKGKKDKERGPSYIAPRNFALAFLDVISEEEPEKAEAKIDETIENGCNKDLRDQLRAIEGEAEKSPVRRRIGIEKWFDDSMDRVSGWYTRRSRWITFGFAVVVTVALNASTIRMVERLAHEPAVRTAVVQQAEAAVEAGESDAPATPSEAGEQISEAYVSVSDLKLPLMWSGENVPWASWKAAGLTAVGWLVTVLAITLGAPFWFDALGKLSHLRSSGKRPDDTAGGKP